MTFEKPEILSTIQAEGIELKQRGRYHWACCPFHLDRTPSFKVDPERNSFYCFSCNSHGDSIAFIMRYKGLSFSEALHNMGLDSSVKPSPETLRRIRQAKERAELIRQFRAWELDYHADLCDLYRGLQERKAEVKTEQELDRISWLYHKELIWECQMEVLESRDDEAKFRLYKEVNENGKRNL